MSESEGDSYDFLFNIVVIGNPDIQKTKLISSFGRNASTPTTNEITDTEHPTTRLIKMDGKVIKSQLWDDSELEKFISLISPLFFREAYGAVLLYNIAERSTYDSIEKYLQNLGYSSEKKFPIILVGNSNEENSEENLRTVTTQEALEFAIKNDLLFVETSLENSENVETVLHTLLANILKNITKSSTTTRSSTTPKSKANKTYDFTFRLILLGDYNVGKTNLRSRFIYDEFSLDPRPILIGADCDSKTVHIKNKKIRAQIWDTNERMRKTNWRYCELAAGVLLIYDITDYLSFQNIEKWLQDLQGHVEDDIVKLMIGNKADLESSRKVSTEEAEEFAYKHQLLFIETSALNSMNIEKAFISALTDIYYKILSKEELNQNPVVFSEKEIAHQFSTPVRPAHALVKIKNNCQII